MLSFEKQFLSLLNKENLIFKKVSDAIYSRELIYLENKNIFFNLISNRSMPNEHHSYQQKMSLEYLANGNSLIHVMQDRWEFQAALMQSRIQSLIGFNKKINARSCKLKRILKKESDAFLVDNHLLGTCNSRFNYGLYHETNLVAVATFSAGRNLTKREYPIRSYEMLRFACITGFTVVGGLSKLISNFEKEHQPNELMTYIDLDWAIPSSYEKLGFLVKSIKAPMEFYIDEILQTRLSIKNNSNEAGQFLRVFNSGSLKLIKTCK